MTSSDLVACCVLAVMGILFPRKYGVENFPH